VINGLTNLGTADANVFAETNAVQQPMPFSLLAG
jgi:hypothetical protein